MFVIELSTPPTLLCQSDRCILSSNESIPPGQVSTIIIVVNRMQYQGHEWAFVRNKDAMRNAGAIAFQTASFEA